MDYAYSETLAAAREWAAAAVAAGRLPAPAAHVLQTLDAGAADTLFAADSAGSGRPLIVAFMGGTGVGKSSLLNRLAGQAIARAGIERPTSREITLYHHADLNLRRLPAGLPLDSVRTGRHQDAANAGIVWMDMPDFDSVETGNRRLVLEWLPYIDVLVYVVSPERYRDGKAWQLLLAEGHRHAWLFVMNQWDLGQPVQFEDFLRQLHKAGFADPLAFRTSCLQQLTDEFPGLVGELQGLSAGHGREQLAAAGYRQRRAELHAALLALDSRLATGDYAQLADFFRRRWQQCQSVLQQGLAWPLRQYAAAWAAQPGSRPELALWDDWAQDCLTDAFDELALQADQQALPVRPLRAALQAFAAHAGKDLARQMELSGRDTLLNPGNAGQRLLLGLTGAGETLLPLAAMSAVGYQVYVGYYQGATAGGHYLGADFAIHSVLLIGLSWLLPFFLHRKLQPALDKAALAGLHKGLQLGLAAIAADVHELIEQESRQQQLLRQQLAALLDRCAAATDQPPRSGLLARLLAD